MANLGGRYEIRNGKRVRVQYTQPAPDPKPQAKAPAKASEPAAQMAQAKSSNVKENGDADQMA
ncbi:hypothetical protein QO259_05650 [Salinicola sp. JS01]|uniref:hypothetical protein n=1 Tax=Salinicola sp. JS01 TaxID=3050071 RepID=UPI00255BC52D|nr:hypothetical protein [Salinicola sp. JS01]WIX34147.1 hypothetical protein QO259_05650 [Salinicola sp. JS01]